MDGVVLQHAGVGIRAGNGLVAVVFVDGLLGADARQDALAAAGEAGEEVWLNKAFSHQQVTFSGQLVDVEVRTGGQNAHVDELIRVKCVVDGDFLMIHDGIAKHAALLFLGGGAGAGRWQSDGDIASGLPWRISSSRMGRVILLGTARVWSLVTSTTFCLPLARSRSAGRQWDAPMPHEPVLLPFCRPCIRAFLR